MAEKQKSVGWVAAMLALVVGYFGWAFMAADYFQHGADGGPRKTEFFANSIDQLSNFGSVMSHAFQNRLWLIIVVGVAEFGVLVLWMVMRKLEREFSRK